MLRFSRFRSVLLVLCASFRCSAGARAQAFELEPELAGVPLGTHMGVLRDPTGALDIHQVATAQPDRLVVPRTAAPELHQAGAEKVSLALTQFHLARVARGRKR